MSRFPTQDRMVSMIVPLWGDDGLIAPLLRDAGDGDPRVEWIIAAVAPGAELRSLGRSGAIRLMPCAEPSRGRQMNAGAAVARGELLCFHHADTEVSPQHVGALQLVAREPGIEAGAFFRRFADRRLGMRVWERMLRGITRRVGPDFGDQSIFVRASVFREVGGFAEIPLMEDVELARRLRRRGRFRLIDPPICSSPRRFRRLGNLGASLVNLTIFSLYFAGVAPERLHRWYYRLDPRGQPARGPAPAQALRE